MGMKRRLLKTTLVAAGVVLATTSAASAHVTVNPSSLPGGGYTELAVRVPTESDKASTVKVQLILPTQQPLAMVAVKPTPGWKVSVAKTKPSTPLSDDDGPVAEVVSSVTWTADSTADGIPPGGFDDFDLSVGPLPASGTMVFKALQTYSDGSIVRWIEPTPASGPEPENPAPTVTLTSATAAATSATAQPSGGSDHWALGLSIAALVVALGGAGLGLRRRAS